MGATTALRLLLRSFCHNTEWKYAVLWRLEHRNQMLLTWGDGYFDNVKQGVAAENTFDNGPSNDKRGIICFGSNMDAQSGCSMGCPIELAVGSMSCHSYSYGEGLLGKVAFTRKHHWMFAGDQLNLPEECSGEYELQFAAGIKTILVVPVLPHGVVQLGSLDMVMEDPKVVAHIKNLFSTLQHDTGACNLLAPRFDHLYPLSEFTPLMGDVSSSTPPCLSGGLPIPVQSRQLAKDDLMALDFCKVTKNDLVTSQLFPFFMVQDDYPVSQDVMSQALGPEIKPWKDENIDEAMVGDLLVDLSKEPCFLGQPTYAEKMIEVDITEYSCVKNESDLSSQTSDVSNRPTPWLSPMPYSYKQDHKYVGFNPYQVKDMADHSFRDESNGEDDYMMTDRLLKFPDDSELHKALGMGSLKEHDDFAWFRSLPKADGLSSLAALCQIEGCEVYEDSIEPNAWFIDDKETEDLLDAIVANLHDASNDNASDLSGCINAYSNLSGKFQDSCITESNNETDMLALDDSVPLSHGRSNFISVHDCSMDFPTESLSKSISMSMNAEHVKGAARAHKKRSSKSPSHTKQRGRSNIHKPRPRDRQLIQDRVKELRELIPNGSKCSIDSLLDRTVKHMLFLQSVSSQAEKLRQCTRLEAKGRNLESASVRAHQTGASWVCQLGSQPEACPLIVEDLDHPGQMLIEMLCNEYGLFIEIAHVIRRLELTILKGVLESRSDKLWARFIIEVARGFHRIDILWPLMQLLQRNFTGIPGKF